MKNSLMFLKTNTWIKGGMLVAMSVSSSWASASHSVTLTWDGVGGADQYRLQERVQSTPEAPSPEFVDVYTGVLTEATVTDRNSGIYQYRVIACITHPIDGALCNTDVATYSETLPVTLGDYVAEDKVEYIYDDLGRLTKVYIDGILMIEYTLDNNGNRITVTYSEVN